MASLMDQVTKHINPAQIERLATQLGASQEQAESAIGLALPTLLGAVTRKADDEGEVQKLHSALNTDSADYDDLGGLLSDGQNHPASQAFSSGGSGLLESILGGRQGKLETGIGQVSGLSSGQLSSLMSSLAPLVIGAIGKQAKQGGFDIGGLAGMLRGEKETLEKQASGGLLSGLLDQDGDGDFDFSDVMKLGMNRLSGK